MFGLEKSPKDKFDFDLEIDIKEHPPKAKKLIDEMQNKILKIKQNLKSGGSKEELNELGVLMQGYTALIKVLKKIQKS